MFNMIRNSCSSNQLLKSITAFQTAAGIKRNLSSDLQLLENSQQSSLETSELRLQTYQEKLQITYQQQVFTSDNSSIIQVSPSFHELLDDDTQHNFQKLIVIKKKKFFIPQDYRETSPSKTPFKSSNSWEPINIRDIIIRMCLPTIEPLFKKAEDIEDLQKVGMISRQKRISSLSIKTKILDSFEFQKLQSSLNKNSDIILSNEQQTLFSNLIPQNPMSAKIESQLFIERMIKLQVNIQ
ncbi:hypothetical protein SS50377_26365 [Spironucleus salmonicida]|uniref:Uncharacterized protein n=1 Tax=Spironucleus salmonicida TaxID=348837 RepID=V6LU49_9EUKA|nr:hypothetical protein SS50377_26365 [Spironucleus salmonicida]|eukprot:EST47768.1 Hypothetical protein SS50377_12167 [Spironucleus salmonicida]